MRRRAFDSTADLTLALADLSLAGLSWAALTLVALSLSGEASAETYYASARATGPGDGSKSHPYATLETAERMSLPGDTIIVLPSPSNVAPLDGGIALKPGQRLIGAGPSVIGRPPNSDAPRITNTSDSRLDGDAVRLAEGTEVNNLVIVDARRAGIYGLDAVDTRVQGNDIAGANTSCAAGLLIYFPAESQWQPLTNGFAAIMMDFDSSRASVDIEGNFIHDASCSDGIDIRASGSADVVARIDGNSITRIKQGPALGSLLGIGLQTRDTASLVVDSSHNAETYLGNLFATPKAGWNASWPSGDIMGANCEGLFTNQTGGSLVWNVARNTFAHGIGGTSCNGAEFFIGAGAARLHVVVRDSIFEDNPGDMIEENNLGSDSLMELAFDNVTVRHATHIDSMMRELPVPALAFSSLTSRSVCMSQFSVGPRAITRFQMVRSHFSDCAGDGILAFYANLPGLGVGTGASSGVEIDQSSIINVGEYALHWIDYAPLDELRIKVQYSRLDAGPGFPAVAADASGAGYVKATHIDLGGGVLGSLGLNCFSGAGRVSIPVDPGVSAGANWWGPSSLSRASGERGVSPMDAAPLRMPPPSCRLPAN